MDTEIKSGETPLVFETSGFKFQQNITEEEKQDLIALNSSPFWRTYKKILSQIRQGYQHSLMPMEDPNKVLKTTGIIVGLNFAEVQLGNLVVQFQQKAERVDAESKKHPQP